MIEKIKQIAAKFKVISCNAFNKSYDYIKLNYNNKCFLMKCTIALLTTILLICMISGNKQTVTYHYIGTSYIKEIREGSDIVKRQLCFIDNDRTSNTSKYISYYCGKELVEYSN
jgi:hypothetical protein